MKSTLTLVAVLALAACGSESETLHSIAAGPDYAPCTVICDYTTTPTVLRAERTAIKGVDSYVGTCDECAERLAGFALGLGVCDGRTYTIEPLSCKVSDDDSSL